MALFDYNKINNNGNPIKIELDSALLNKKLYVSVQIEVADNKALIMGHSAIVYNGKIIPSDLQFNDVLIDWCQDTEGKRLYVGVNISKTILGMTPPGNVKAVATCTLNFEVGDQLLGTKYMISDKTNSEPNSIFDFLFEFSKTP